MKAFWIFATDKTAILFYGANREAAIVKYKEQYPYKLHVHDVPAIEDGKGYYMRPLLPAWAEWTFPNYKFNPATPLQEHISE